MSKRRSGEPLGLKTGDKAFIDDVLVTIDSETPSGILKVKYRSGAGFFRFYPDGVQVGDYYGLRLTPYTKERAEEIRREQRQRELERTVVYFFDTRRSRAGLPLEGWEAVHDIIGPYIKR